MKSWNRTRSLCPFRPIEDLNQTSSSLDATQRETILLSVTHFARRFLALIAALAALAAMWNFTSTSMVWEWMGRPSEVYPEMAFLVFGLPAAIVAIASGVWIAIKARASASQSWTLTLARGANVIGLAICAWLCWFALSAFLGHGDCFPTRQRMSAFGAKTQERK